MKFIKKYVEIFAAPFKQRLFRYCYQRFMEYEDEKDCLENFVKIREFKEPMN